MDLSKFSTGKMKFNYSYIDLLSCIISCIKIIIGQCKELNINSNIDINIIDNNIDKAIIWGDKTRIK